jgi:GNAT superfamily N-acetyltransferase
MSITPSYFPSSSSSSSSSSDDDDDKIIFIRRIKFGSDEFQSAVQLRHRLLRQPLGLQFTDTQLAEESESIHFVAIQGNAVMGTVQLVPLSDGTVKLRQMAVDTKWQNRGIGRRLVEYAERWAVENKFYRVALHARVIAKGFYVKLGYSIDGTEFIEVGLPHIVLHKLIARDQSHPRETSLIG